MAPFIYKKHRAYLRNALVMVDFNSLYIRCDQTPTGELHAALSEPLMRFAENKIRITLFKN
jgi:hypothetical protein